MSLNKPPLIKVRHSRLKGSEFTQNSFFQQPNVSNSDKEDNENGLFGNFLSSNYTGSTSNLHNTSQFNSDNNHQAQTTLNFNTNHNKHRKKQTTTASHEESLNTTKRPPITPRKSLNNEETSQSNQAHLNVNANFNNYSFSKNNGSNPFIVKHSNSSKRLVHLENDLNKSFVDYETYKVLRGVFNYENRSVDLELDQNVIRMKPTNGKILFLKQKNKTPK